MQIMWLSGRFSFIVVIVLGSGKGNADCREHPPSCLCPGNNCVSSSRNSCYLRFCLVGHVELGQGGGHLFVCKSSSLPLLILSLLLGISYSIPVCLQ